jgi:hypothetical protein
MLFLRNLLHKHQTMSNINDKNKFLTIGESNKGIKGQQSKDINKSSLKMLNILDTAHARVVPSEKLPMTSIPNTNKELWTEQYQSSEFLTPHMKLYEIMENIGKHNPDHPFFQQ